MHETDKVIADMSGGESRVRLFCSGGRGGNGNQHYATATMQAPKYAQPGQPGIELEVRLELKGHCRCRSGRFPKCWKIHSAVPCDKCPAKDRQLSFHNFKPESGRCGPGQKVRALSSQIFRD